MARIDTKHYVTEQLSAVLQELRETLSQLEHGGRIVEYDLAGNESTRLTPPLYEVFSLMSAARRDGFKSSSRPGGTPSSVLDDEGVPMPPLSDPTGELATENVKIHDPMRRHGQAAILAISDARELLLKAKSEMIRAFEESDVQAGEIGCRVHAEAGLFEEPSRGDRCSWCYRFWLEHGDTDAPPELVRLKEKKGRVTERDVKEALMAPRPPKKRAGAA